MIIAHWKKLKRTYIYEAAALGYDQKEAQRWAKQQLDEAIKKIAKREIPKSLEENILTQRGAV